MNLPNEIHADISAADYHAMTNRVSKSHLDRIARSPLHYRHYMSTPSVSTPAMMLGTALHCAVLEPNLYVEQYAVEPEFGDLRTKAAKEAREEWRAVHGHKIAIAADRAALIAGMRDALFADKDARLLLSGGAAEQTVLFDLDGTPCKARLDYYLPKFGAIIDLKSTLDASPHAFARSCASFRYHVQQAFYSQGAELAGLNVESFAFVAVESEPPHAVGVYELDLDAVMAGKALYERDLRTLNRCRASGEWPAYATGIKTISLAPWSLNT